MSPDRRRFLRFLAASPLAARAIAQDAPIASAKDALEIMDFEPAARKALPAAHWGYMASGVDDDLTLAANREGYRHVQLKPRRLVDVSKVDTKIQLFGVTWDSPVFLCPVGSQRAFHPDGEAAAARAAKNKKTLQILSTMTSIPVEDVNKARGEPVWYQLYMPLTWNETEKMVRRVEDAGCPALAWTVDLLGGRNTETMERFRRRDTRDCSSCHSAGQGGATNVGGGAANLTRPMFKGLDGAMNPAGADWSYVDRLKKMTKMKLLLKGIDSREDARLAREHGVDGIIVSNHGGRATETLRSTIECLPEVVDGAGPQIPVLIDGGVRRGTDVYKALALGARAVGIGRPYIYGMSAFGQDGVETVIDILRKELEMTMRQCGTPTIAKINSAVVAKAF